MITEPNNWTIKCCLLNIRPLRSKSLLVIDSIWFDLVCLTETWQQKDEYVSLNEATPPTHIKTHIPPYTPSAKS